MSEQVDRPLGHAMLNGAKCRCPRCGEGKLFRRYLKVAERCDNCGLDYSHHRADDLPAYVAITIVGHILVVGLMHFQMGETEIAPWVYLAWLVPLAIVLPLVMLPSIKGAIVGMQWAQRMHGF
ncbi:DUF983 domain-containing protein [Devosia sp. RR2S18]|jgi:uncharacterized protein (DUF983 family)|uniref:DUF983 domain-containing protein n=1 Tax=Devosia rhizosphaerae TaxID=3049774 RepID=UPI00254174E6|nr:DUF983 domain-containing protein [Devosia sp. RR2S18]WIJ23480.1 DUF983 domain-containing protein [Devosia sp. RR2S18]